VIGYLHTGDRQANSFVLAPKIAKNLAETFTPNTDSSQYSFVLEKDFEQYF